MKTTFIRYPTEIRVLTFVSVTEDFDETETRTSLLISIEGDICYV